MKLLKKKKKLVSLGIFIDLSKAFDHLNHNILIAKLDMYGVRGTMLSLIKSYLLNRKQCVSHNSFLSSTEDIKSGVPQGSILGPLLFIIYMNDVFNINTEVQSIAYADDITLFFTGTDPDKLIVSANNFLSSLKIWADLNCLKINANKTKALLFRPRNKIARVSTNLCLGGNNIEFVQEIKALGVFFSEHLTWDQHINHVGMKLNKLNGLMNKHRHILPQNTKKNFYIILCFCRLSLTVMSYGEQLQIRTC